MRKTTAILVTFNLLLLAAAAWAAGRTPLRNVALINATVQLGSGTVLTGTEGNSGTVQQAGSMTATAGLPVCSDANGNTQNGSANCGISLISTGKSTGVCATSGSSYGSCSTVVTISPTQPDTNYIASCTGVSGSGRPYIDSVTKSTGSITVLIRNGTSDGAVASSYSELDCSALHP